VNSTYGINLNLSITNPGATYSDHASFWSSGFGAVLVIEDWTFDANPHYHTDTDLIAYFNLPYYLKLAKLSIASLASLATPVGFAGTRPLIKRDEVSIYPNPANHILNIQLNNGNDNRSLAIYNSIGELIQIIETISDKFISISTENWTNGIYFIQMNSGEITYTSKFIKQ
jgi:hypothetical protein